VLMVVVEGGKCWWKVVSWPVLTKKYPSLDGIDCCFSR
jgi:hypothetical protein